MKYLLDSDAVNVLYDDGRKKHHKAIHRKISLLRDEDMLQISVLVLYELEYSFFNAPADKKICIRNTIDSLLRDFDAVLPVEQVAAPVFGELKALLRKKKNLSRKEMRKHNIDIMLASTAIINSSVLVGADSIYGDIENLNPMFRSEDWFDV
ncbi:type II toxin-antitoxin system VapC family toxin [Desulfonema magnum]|uniref:PIN domain-containing protein n=1 Tax=Desulfonema magnum TaxID=45655 RepID=A0A975BX62_9BACT|nr:type II toxin-antitoxin system VapC family toxin [Desulfonema magnum]QTA92992.1 PIN domain-containing protein [Desulfonema magnum]